MLTDRESVSWLTERDIDLLIAAELHGDNRFAGWLLGACGQPDASFEAAWVSVSESAGESDLVVQARTDRGSVALLIENKVAAAFQPDQDVRYRSRARSLVQRGKCVHASTVLMAPQLYISGSQADFDFHLSYEGIASQLLSQGDPRSGFTARALEVGIEARRRGYVAIPDDAATAFWRTYYDLCAHEFPHLGMQLPRTKPSGSSFCYFPVPSPGRFHGRRVQLIHKWERGAVDLQFSATTVHELRGWLSQLPDGAKLARANDSAVLRYDIAQLSMQNAVEEQLACIRQALQYVSDLQTYAHALMRT